MGEGFRLHSGVLELIAGMALLELKGGSCAGASTDAAEARPKKKNLARGIKASQDGGEVRFSLDLNVDYGADALAVGKAAQELVRGAVEAMTGYRVVEVGVNVVGLRTP
jgi:uncharacterized alkaline shock family protein YloU